MGEDKISFETYCGNVKIEPTTDLMTPFGGLAPFASFLKKTNILEELALSCPVTRVSPNASSVFDELRNQWGFDGFTSRKQQVTEHVARMTLLMYNLWNLFSRLMDPDKHVEAITG